MSEEPVGGARIIAGRYELTRQLEPGGTTWAATDTSHDRPGGAQVALREFTVPQGTSDDDRRALISQATWEACQLAQLRDNPNVLRFHGAVEEDGRLWIVTELLSGPDVGRIVAESGPLPAAEAGRIGAAVLGALAASHALGVVHRAVRPGNIVRREDGRVVLTGFDVAPAQSFPAPAELDFTDPHRLRTGQATFAGDVFSLGSTLYYLVEGVAPFSRPDPQAQAIAISAEEPPQPLRAGPIGAVMYTLLRKNQAEIPAPAAAQAQINAALAAAASPAAAPAQPAPAQTGLAQFDQTQLAPAQPLPAQPGPMFVDPAQFDQIQAGQTYAGAIPTGPAGPAGLPAGPVRPSAASRTLWLLTAVASAVTTGAAFMTSWGTVTFKFPDSPVQSYTGSLIKIIKSGAGGPGTDPAPAVVAWLAPLLLPLIGTIVLGVIAAASRRRLGWLCVGSALLGLAGELGAYWWTADIGGPSSIPLPNVSLHAWGYVGIAASGVAFLLAAAAGLAGRSQAPTPAPISVPGASGSPFKAAVRIVAAVGAILTVAAVFLPFYGYGVGHDQTKMNAWQWSQDTVPAIAVCLIAVLVLALLSLSPGRRITTAQLIVPAAVALLMEVMMPIQVIGLEVWFSNENKNTLFYGAWVGVGLSAVVLIATTLSHRKSAAAAPQYGYDPYAMPPGQNLPTAPQTMMAGQHGYPYVPPQQGPPTTTA